MAIDKIKNVSLCPCLLTMQVAFTDRENFKYTSSHLPGFMFIFAMRFLNEPFIQSRDHAVFLPSFIIESFLLTTIKENIHP